MRSSATAWAFLGFALYGCDGGSTSGPDGQGGDVGTAIPGSALFDGLPTGGSFDCSRLEEVERSDSPGGQWTWRGLAGDERFDARLVLSDGTVVQPIADRVQDRLQIVLPVVGLEAVTAELALWLDETVCAGLAEATIQPLPRAPAETLPQIESELAAIAEVITANAGKDAGDWLVDDAGSPDALTQLMRAAVLVTRGSETVPGLRQTIAALDVDEREHLARLLHASGFVELVESVRASMEAGLSASKSANGFAAACGVLVRDIETSDQLACWMRIQQEAAKWNEALSDPYTQAAGVLVGLVAARNPRLQGPAAVSILLSALIKLETEAIRDLAPSSFVGDDRRQIAARGDEETFDWDDPSQGRLVAAEVVTRSRGWKIDAFTLVDIFLTALGGAGGKLNELVDLRRLASSNQPAAVRNLLGAADASLQQGILQKFDELLAVLLGQLQAATGLAATSVGGLFTVYEFEAQEFRPIDVLDDVTVINETPAPLRSFDVDEASATWSVWKHNPTGARGPGRQDIRVRFREDLRATKWRGYDPTGTLTLAVECVRIDVVPRAPTLVPGETEIFQASLRNLTNPTPDDLFWTPPARGTLSPTDGDRVQYTAPAESRPLEVRLRVGWTDRLPDRDVREECPASFETLIPVSVHDCCAQPQAELCTANVRCRCDEPPIPDECALPPECEDPTVTTAGRLIGPYDVTWAHRDGGTLLQVPRHERWVMVDLNAYPPDDSFLHFLQFGWPPPAYTRIPIETSPTGAPTVAVDGEYRGYWINPDRVTGGFLETAEVVSSTVTGRRYVEGEYRVEGVFVRYEIGQIVDAVAGIIRGCFRAENFVD